MIKYGNEVECKICGDQAIFMDTKLCDHCMNLLRQIAEDPILVEKMLEMVPDTANMILPKKSGLANCFAFGKKIKKMSWRFVKLPWKQT